MCPIANVIEIVDQNLHAVANKSCVTEIRNLISYANIPVYTFAFL